MHLAAKAGMLAAAAGTAAVEGGAAAANALNLSVDLEKLIGWGTLVGMVVGAVWYIERRIKSHLQDHTSDEQEKAETRHSEIKRELKAARSAQRAEILHLRELLSLAGVIPEHTPVAVRLPVDDGTIPPDVDPEPTPGG